MAGNLTDDEEARLLDISLENGDVLALTSTPPTESSAGDEVTGGSYSRQALAWSIELDGSRTVTTDIEFNDMPNTVVAGWNVYDSTGTDRKWWGLLSTVDALIYAGYFWAVGHGLSDDTEVVLQDGFSPDGVSSDDHFFVIDSDADSFYLSETISGAAVVWTDDSERIVIGKVYDISAGSNFVIPAGSSSISFKLT